MAQIIREIRVDVSQPCNLQAILAKQYDCNSRFLKITLTDCGTKIDVSKTSKVTINTNRPDGQSKSFVGIANGDGTVTVPLPQWSLSIAGTLICDVSVTDTSKNERLTTMDIFVEVKEAANDNTDVSENPDGEIIVITPTKKISENSTDNEYPSAKAVYDLDNITATASGSAITIESANAPLQQLKLYGSTEQNGTPTPDAPVPLVSVGDNGSFEVGVFGKNLLEISKEAGFVTTNRGVTYTVNDDKSISVSGTPTDTTNWKNLYFSDYKFSLPKGNYKFACKGLKNSTKLHPILYYIDSTNQLQVLASYVGKGVESIPFTITDENKNNIYLVIGCAPDYTPQGERLYISIFPESVTDLTYEPYNKQILTMPYTLPSVADIQEEIDFAKGVKISKVGVYKSLISNADLVGYGGGLFSVNSIYNFKEYAKISCNMFIEGDTRTTNNTIETNRGDKKHPYFRCEGFETVDAFKSAYGDKEIVIHYELETPIEIQLTETELNAYRHLMTNKGNTTVLSECEDTEITYYINKPNAQAIGSLHEQINKDYFKLQQAIITTGGSTL